MGPTHFMFYKECLIRKALYRNPGKVAFLIECVTETSGTYISINFIDTV